MCIYNLMYAVRLFSEHDHQVGVWNHEDAPWRLMLVHPNTVGVVLQHLLDRIDAPRRIDVVDLCLESIKSIESINQSMNE